MREALGSCEQSVMELLAFAWGAGEALGSCE